MNTFFIISDIFFRTNCNYNGIPDGINKPRRLAFLPFLKSSSHAASVWYWYSHWISGRECNKEWSIDIQGEDLVCILNIRNMHHNIHIIGIIGPVERPPMVDTWWQYAMKPSEPPFPILIWLQEARISNIIIRKIYIPNICIIVWLNADISWEKHRPTRMLSLL